LHVVPIFHQQKLICMTYLLDMLCAVTAFSSTCLLMVQCGVSLPGCQCWNSIAAARSARSWTIRTVCLAKVQQLRFISALHCSLEQMQYHIKEKGHVVNPRGPLTGKSLNPGKQIIVMEICWSK